MIKIVIFGANGFAGSNITAEAVGRGHTVVGVSRSIDGDSTSATEAQVGSIHDPEFVREITEDADVIAVAVRAAADANGARLINAIPSLIAQAASTGARIGFVGGAGSLRVTENGPALHETPGFPEVAKREATAHAELLEYLRSNAEGARWFYLSPAAQFGAFIPGERTGQYRTTGDVMLADAQGQSIISGADYAIAFVDEIENAAHENERFGVAY